jgi:hypothetical protein
MDIHPVAVIIARVTYLLALAPAIAARAGSLSIPVYLGDAMQLSTASIMGLTDLVIAVPPPPEAAQLRFPEIFCKEIGLFDKLVAQMREGSEQKLKPKQIEPAFVRIIEQYYKRDILPAEKAAISEILATYVIFDNLRKQGRDTVWTYVARNLSRPLALAFGDGWAKSWPKQSACTLVANLPRRMTLLHFSPCARSPSTFAPAGTLLSSCRLLR